MQKTFSFLAGMISGVLVGAAAVLLLTPYSGSELREGAEARWQGAISEARLAMDEKRRELENQFESATRS